MNISKARELANDSRWLIGMLTRECRFDPDHRDNYIKDIRTHHKVLKRLYLTYPEIKPIRTRQLSVFDTAGSGKTFSLG